MYQLFVCYLNFNCCSLVQADLRKNQKEVAIRQLHWVLENLILGKLLDTEFLYWIIFIYFIYLLCSFIWLILSNKK